MFKKVLKAVVVILVIGVLTGTVVGNIEMKQEIEANEQELTNTYNELVKTQKQLENKEEELSETQEQLIKVSDQMNQIRARNEGQKYMNEEVEN